LLPNIEQPVVVTAIKPIKTIVFVKFFMYPPDLGVFI
jgi:hypothetical protein